MPLFEYKCLKCSHKFEVLASRSAAAPEKCPACGESALEKVFSPFAVSVSGSSQTGGECAPEGCEGCPAAGGGCPYGDDDF